MALDIKKILKGLRILNDSDSTKALELSVSGSTNTKTTVTTSQTANRTITLPDATDTLVGKATTDVLTNKSIDADTNTITNIENADIKSGAAIDATKIHDGTVDNTEFGYLNGVTSAIQTQLNNKENSSNKGIANGYASLDSNGLVPTTQMPPAALERLVVVADQAARFALTTATVQNGDTVYQNDTTTMYFVKDDTNLGNSSGYTIYSAGTSVNFSGSLAGDIAGTQGATTYNNVVPVAKGGTNSSSALTNNKVIVSTAGAIVESAVTSTTLGYLDATSSIQTQLDAKSPIASPTFTGTTTVAQIIDSGLTANTVPYANGSKQLTSSAVTPTELGYVSGVTSAIQTQINALSGVSIPSGLVSMYGAASAPSGWLLCDGAAVSRTTYAALFTAISTTFGTGDGSTTFNVPDIRGIFVRGAGTHGTLTNANGTAFSGTLGTQQNDKMQGHAHSGNFPQVNGSHVSDAGTGTLYGVGPTNSAAIGNPSTDGANGTPRTGAETNPANISLTYIIKT